MDNNHNQVITNKERLRNLEEYVKSLDKNIKTIDDKLDELKIDFTKLATKIVTEQKDRERVLSLRIWLIALIISVTISIVGLFIK